MSGTGNSAVSRRGRSPVPGFAGLDPARRGEAGLAGFLALLLTVVGFGLVAFVVALFATGLAQEQIWPRIQARVDAAVAGLPIVGRDAVETPPLEAGTAPADSLEALLTQLETHEAFLERRNAEFLRTRAEIDSVLAALKTVQNDEVARQAKLFAAMKPEESARILNSLDDATLVAVLKKMNARAASKVMGRLDPRRIARLSMEGIGRPQLAGLGVPSQGGNP